jgi:DNA polymerase
VKVLASDSGQIEARVTGWLAGHEKLLEDFTEQDGQPNSVRDVYTKFISTVFQRDITTADKDERFVGKTSILGLGYSMGWLKFALTLLTNAVRRIQFTIRHAEEIGVDVEKFINNEDKVARVTSMPSRLVLGDRLVHCAVAEKVVQVYRNQNAPIVELWGMMDLLIQAMDAGEERAFGPGDVLRTERHALVLPNGLKLRYPGLREGENGYSYIGGHGKERVKLYGGKLTENAVQALARIIISDQMLMIFGKYGLRPVTCTHDELVYVASDDEADATYQKVRAEMRIAPEWAAGLPLNAGGGVGDSYGEAK